MRLSLDVISRIIKVEVIVISRISKTESNNCFIIHCFEENNDKHRRKEPELILLLEIMHYGSNLQISQLSASR